MFPLTDSSPLSPPANHWSWKRWLAILSGLLLVLTVFMVLHDENLEPYDDLRQKAGIAPPDEVNGFLFLISGLKAFPDVPKADRKISQAMIDGLTPWEPEHLHKMKSGREKLPAHFDQALAMPSWMAPVGPMPDGSVFTDYSSLMAAYQLLRLEIAGDLQDGRRTDALAGLERLHRLFSRQLDGSSDLLSFMVALSLHQPVLESWADYLEKAQPDPAALQELAGRWAQDPPIAGGFSRALAGESLYFETFIKVLKNVSPAGNTPKPGSALAPLLIKRNKTLNDLNRNLRKLMALGLAPYPDRAAAEAAGAAEGPAVPPILPAWLDLNLTGSQLLDASGYQKMIPGILRHLFDARAFRVKIALHKWEADHGRGLPATLDKLVPDYLAEVPADPWNGQPLLWDPATGIIYAVGSDWTPDLPSAADFKNKWFSGEHKIPGLRFARPVPAPGAGAPPTLIE